jgi:hypothetical protein
MRRISDDGLIQIPDGKAYAPVRTRHGPQIPQMTVATDPYRRTLWHTLAVLRVQPFIKLCRAAAHVGMSRAGHFQSPAFVQYHLAVVRRKN